MKKLLLNLSVVTAIGFSPLAVHAEYKKQIEQEKNFVPNQLLVKYKSGPVNFNLPVSLQHTNAQVKNLSDASRSAVIEFNSNDLEQMSKELMATGLYEYVEYNYILKKNVTPNDPRLAQQFAVANAQLAGADLNLLAAWDIQPDAKDVLVAVIDDGFDLTHEDLSPSYVNSGKCFTSDPAYCGGTTDAGFTADDQNHGTLVTGTFGARANNALGIAGASWEVDVLPLKVDLSIAAIVEAVDEAIAQNAKIVNMSFGGSGLSQTALNAYLRAEAAGILLVTSAGNSDQNNDVSKLHFPSNAPAPNILSIAATTNLDNVTSFSEWGPLTTELAAPGQAVQTTAINNSYSNANGTSFASPYVAGVAALVQARTGATDYKQLKAHLINGGELGAITDLGNAPGTAKGAPVGRTAAGRLDAVKALADIPGGVIVINNVEIDDSVKGNNNGVLDSGETADIAITLENVWNAETNVVGTLSTTASLATVNVAQSTFGDIAKDGFAIANFEVTAPTFTGNNQDFYTLDLASNNGALPSRYFYLEISSLTPGQTLTQSIQRWDWDEYHAFSVDVPQGASNLVVETTTQGGTDIDILVKFGSTPDYFIQLNPPADDDSPAFTTDNDTLRGTTEGGNENVTVAAPQAGTYHIVVVNFDQTAHDYTIRASFDAPAPGIFNFNPTAISVDEAAGTATMTVERDGDQGAVSVDYASANGTATAGADYTASNGTLNWADGDQTAKTFTVDILDDNDVESAENFQFSLSNATGGASIGANSVATLTINDDDAPGALQFSSSTASVSEATASVTVTVTRTGGSKGAASIDFATANGTASAGSDYTATNGTLNWADGDSANKTFSVSITNDTAIESSETVALSLSNATVASLGTPANMTLTITDNDTPTTPPPSSGGGGGGSMAWFIPLLLWLRLRKNK